MGPQDLLNFTVCFVQSRSQVYCVVSGNLHDPPLSGNICHCGNVDDGIFEIDDNDDKDEGDKVTNNDDDIDVK